MITRKPFRPKRFEHIENEWREMGEPTQDYQPWKSRLYTCSMDEVRTLGAIALARIDTDQI
jgi:hypothetical protein